MGGMCGLQILILGGIGCKSDATGIANPVQGGGRRTADGGRPRRKERI